MDKFSVVDCLKDIGGDWEYILKSDYDELQAKLTAAEEKLAKIYATEPVAWADTRTAEQGDGNLATLAQKKYWTERPKRWPNADQLSHPLIPKPTKEPT